MIRIHALVLLIFLLGTQLSNAQDIYQRNENADVIHYVFSLALNDENNEIRGETLITVDLKDQTKPFTLDLISKVGKYGMVLDGIFENESKVLYNYANHKISIPPSQKGSSTKTYKIKYHGIPRKGLVIDTTKFGRRSFFGDNWPNLTRNWLPCVDHPYDKASVEFRITAPAHYDVVATGKKVEESSLGNGYKLTSYLEPAPVAMKVVTIGVTEFATKELGMIAGIPVSAWVYPENRTEGFSDYAVATDVLQYFIDEIGPYSFAKLANMQAKTQWGGLENAGTIAYFENSVTGNNEVEGLIAHEIAHQWFGNSATENSWNHVWLSEGFATYFTILYQETKYGDDKRKEELITDREQIIEYFQKNPSPVINNAIKDPMNVLSTNTYQKGGWFLNMLRRKLGDELFWKGIRSYYQQYKDANAMTEDFRIVMEKVSGQELEGFFHQWLFVKGFPEIKWSWRYKKGKVLIKFNQLQTHHIFDFPVDIAIIGDNQQKILETVIVNDRSQEVELSIDFKPDNVILDPDVWLLFEEIK